MTNWDHIRQKWERSDVSFKALADKYGLKDATIRSRKNRENWQRNVATKFKNVATNKGGAPPSAERVTQTATDLGNEQNPTRSEQALLEALLNPEHRIKSVTDVCKIAKVDRTTYYRAFAKPEFVEIMSIDEQIRKIIAEEYQLVYRQKLLKLKNGL